MGIRRLGLGSRLVVLARTSLRIRQQGKKRVHSMGEDVYALGGDSEVVSIVFEQADSLQYETRVLNARCHSGICDP